jgi:hypothetical protein
LAPACPSSYAAPLGGSDRDTFCSSRPKKGT